MLAEAVGIQRGWAVNRREGGLPVRTVHPAMPGRGSIELSGQGTGERGKGWGVCKPLGPQGGGSDLTGVPISCIWGLKDHI